MPQWRHGLKRSARRIWFRAALISALSVVLALASAWLAPLIPYEFSLKIGSDSVDNILTILASSMLAVTTFSLTAMVAAFSRAAQQVTPRATQLLIEDKTAQNALSTFLGAFLFAIVGIIALSTDAYGAQGRVILYIGTIALIAWIAFTLLRWIAALTNFGRVENAIQRIERAAVKAIEDRTGPILLAGKADLSAPAGASVIAAPETGYVTIINRAVLDRCAREAQVIVTICAPTGEMVSRRHALAWTSEPVDEKIAEAMASAFAIEAERTFEEDPRFAMVVLAEIGSRALSRAVNDPGTAIAALNAGQRVLEAVAEQVAKPSECERVIDPPLALESMAEDLILPIARDGADMAEVGIRLQHMLGVVANEVPPAAGAMRKLADDALERVRRGDVAPTDRDRIERAQRTAFG